MMEKKGGTGSVRSADVGRGLRGRIVDDTEVVPPKHVGVGKR